MFKEYLKKILFDNPVVPVLVIDRLDMVKPLGQSLLEGGIKAVELTLRTDVSMDAVIEMQRLYPELMVGVGTVINASQVRMLSKESVKFAVSPGTNSTVLKTAKECDLSFAPGVATPSDIETALSFDCRVLKFFPAEPSGSVKYMKTFSDPYKHLNLSFIPLGGINFDNFEAYLQSNITLAVGGSWIAPRKLIQNREWNQIKDNAATATAKAKRIREKGNSNG
jgi:2-dehydro-3-deoxyphosphogluconate aldolase/(4S)-4-hydroxy-2-oxoglutarate aldolase